MTAQGDRLVTGMGGSVLFTYGHALRGFAAELPPRALSNIGAGSPNRLLYTVGLGQ